MKIVQRKKEAFIGKKLWHHNLEKIIKYVVD